MTIRQANSQDLPQLSALLDGYRIFYRMESDLAGAKTFLTERLTQKDSVIYVAESVESKLVGFVQLYPLFSTTRMKKYWLLNDLYVSPVARGKQISVRLIDQAKQHVIESNACGMYLETEKSNDIGNNLYPRVGFKLNEVSNYYEWDIDM